VLEAAKEHNKNNEDNKKNNNNKKSKDNHDDEETEDNKEASFDPIPGEILYLSYHLSPYCLPYLSSCSLLLIFIHIIHRILCHGLSLSFQIHLNKIILSYLILFNLFISIF
jgi:hypothetical protein